METIYFNNDPYELEFFFEEEFAQLSAFRKETVTNQMKMSKERADELRSARFIMRSHTMLMKKQIVEQERA